MKLVNRHILLLIIVLSTLLGVLKCTIPQYKKAISNHISYKDYSVSNSTEKSLNILLIEDLSLKLFDAEDTENNFLAFLFYIVILLSYFTANINNIKIFFRVNRKKHIRERDKYQLFLSLQVPS